MHVLKMILWGRNVKNLMQVAQQIQQMGVKCVAMQCDVTNKRNIREKVMFHDLCMHVKRKQA